MYWVQLSLSDSIEYKRRLEVAREGLGVGISYISLSLSLGPCRLARRRGMTILHEPKAP